MGWIASVQQQARENSAKEDGRTILFVQSESQHTLADTDLRIKFAELPVYMYRDAITFQLMLAVAVFEVVVAQAAIES